MTIRRRRRLSLRRSGSATISPSATASCSASTREVNDVATRPHPATVPGQPPIRIERRPRRLCRRPSHLRHCRGGSGSMAAPAIRGRSKASSSRPPRPRRRRQAIVARTLYRRLVRPAAGAQCALQGVACGRRRDHLASSNSRRAVGLGLSRAAYAGRGRAPAAPMARTASSASKARRCRWRARRAAGRPIVGSDRLSR